MIQEPRRELATLVDAVRRRWRGATGLRAGSYGAGAAALILACAVLVQWRLAPQGLALAMLWSAAMAGAVACLVWALLSVRRVPPDLQVARFIEECCPELEDALATAIAASQSPDAAMVEAVERDAIRRTSDLDLDRVISRRLLRQWAIRAAAAAVALVLAAGWSARPATQALQTLSFYLFPNRAAVDVSPGNVKIREGDTLRVTARIASGTSVVPVLRIGESDHWREARMEQGAAGFVATIDYVEQDFKYLVKAAGFLSPEYAVTVVRAPHVTQIDLRYDYPAAFHMEPREETDGGDIYGPAGTRVRVTVHVDQAVARGALNLTGEPPVALQPHGGTLEGTLTISDDGSYRVALADADGVVSPGDVEYFIRTLQDRPPDVRILRPAGDRQVTPLEEVPVEARADDDFGVASLDLVYSVNGGADKAVPFDRHGSGITVTGRRTVFLEDARVRAGDFISYYARARDVSRGKRSSEARSDIFFLEVTPFDEEFVAAQTQGGTGGGDDSALEDLIQGEKDIITATWNLDRRGRQNGARSEDDLRAVAHGQRALRTRASGALAQMQRASDLRRRRQPGAAGQPLAADPAIEAIGRAVEAMGVASGQLDALKTADALPPEMTALNELLRAQAEVRRREVPPQANGNGGRGSNRREQDLSSLFDRELSRQQQTNYETPASREARQKDANGDALDRIRDLAHRQDELNRAEQQLARNREKMSSEELRRQLERLTREQSELRQQAEELARQMQQAGRGNQGNQGGQGAQGGRGAQNQASRDLRQISEDMQGAAGELRRENPQQASARGSRAAEGLRNLEQQMRGAQPDDRRRQLGELQLESQQLAEAERRLSEDGAQNNAGARDDGARRRGAEQERLADRTERLEAAVRRLAEAGKGTGTDQREHDALNEAARQLATERLSERMRNAARAEQQGASGSNRKPQEEIARALESVAGRLGAATGQSEQSQRLTEELARIRQLREDLAALDRQLSELRGRGAPQDSSQNGRGPQQPGRGRQTADPEAPWQEARELLNELRQEESLEAKVPDANGFNPGRSAPGTEAWKQDFAKWDELKVQIAGALERAERSRAEQLRGQQARDRLNAGATQAVPEPYRRLVERYYRALAK
jgi:hypothetical protein